MQMILLLAVRSVNQRCESSGGEGRPRMATGGTVCGADTPP